MIRSRSVGKRYQLKSFVLAPSGTLLNIPTVPFDVRHAAAFALPEQVALEPDTRFEGKIKWYVKPLAFGGNAADEANLAWITHDQHAQLVRWWNEQYQAQIATAEGK